MLHFIKSLAYSDFIVDNRLDEIETDLDPQLFFRLNRQFIANYRSVDRVQAWFGGKLKVQVKPAAYEEMIVSRLKATAFKRWLGGEWGVCKQRIKT